MKEKLIKIRSFRFPPFLRLRSAPWQKAFNALNSCIQDPSTVVLSVFLHIVFFCTSAHVRVAEFYYRRAFCTRTNFATRDLVFVFGTEHQLSSGSIDCALHTCWSATPRARSTLTSSAALRLSSRSRFRVFGCFIFGLNVGFKSFESAELQGSCSSAAQLAFLHTFERC